MQRVRTLSDLKDSRLLYEKNFPPFGYFIILAVALLIAGVVVWSIHTPRVYIVKAQGIVESPAKNYVMSPFTGEITEISLKEGEVVGEGDVLFSVKSTELNLQGTQLSAQKGFYETQIRQLDKFVKSVQQDKNLFSASSADDRLYYSRYEQYKATVTSSNPSG